MQPRELSLPYHNEETSIDKEEETEERIMSKPQTGNS